MDEPGLTLESRLLPRAPSAGLPPVRRPISAARRSGSKSAPSSPTSASQPDVHDHVAPHSPASRALLQAPAGEPEEPLNGDHVDAGRQGPDDCDGAGCTWQRRPGSAALGQVMMSRSVHNIRNRVIESRRIEQTTSSRPGALRGRRQSVVEATFDNGRPMAGNGRRPSAADVGAQGGLLAFVDGRQQPLC
mmetsp:Transcript_93656/g.264867  ORF Transcript_93656/g.264867 Transcript_93656/m.264867 type:complete len:190 (+) Transcript_93656:86-655(+)